MNEARSESLKYLRLGGLLAHWDSYLKLAAEKRFSHDHLLNHVVTEECRIKRENAASAGSAARISRRSW